MTSTSASPGPGVDGSATAPSGTAVAPAPAPTPPTGTAGGEHDTGALLDELVAHCIEVLGADAAAVLVGDAHDQLRVAAASSEIVVVEPLVLSSDDNPYVHCYRTASQVRIPDIVEVRSRWPEFVVAVERAGTFRSVHVLPMRLHGTTTGALSLFHRAPGALSHTDLGLAQALADVAAIGILFERTIRRSELVTEQLQAAFTRRVVVEQAKGMIGHCSGSTMDEAFLLLRDHCRRRDLRLSDLAEQIVSGAVDPAGIVAAARGRHRLNE